MNTPMYICQIFTLTGDSLENPSNEEKLSILYFDQHDDLRISMNTDYTDTIEIFFMGNNFGALSQFLPFVKNTRNYIETQLEHVTCVVPEGRNFFEEDFTEFNSYLGLSKTRDFKFSM